jgi:hypothetical protein
MQLISLWVVVVIEFCCNWNLLRNKLCYANIIDFFVVLFSFRHLMIISKHAANWTNSTNALRLPKKCPVTNMIRICFVTRIWVNLNLREFTQLPIFNSANCPYLDGVVVACRLWSRATRVQILSAAEMLLLEWICHWRHLVCQLVHCHVQQRTVVKPDSPLDWVGSSAPL